MNTKRINITPLDKYSEIRVDTIGSDTHITVYNCDIHHLDLLIMQLEALRAEYADMPVKKTVEFDENDEPLPMVAVMGKKVDPTAWYGKALAKEAARITSQPEPESKPASKTESTKYFTCAETATFVRQALKEAFPTQKFSVRSKVYSGGASITIGWLDGVTEYEVNQVVQRFRGADFDGMIDLKSNVYRSDENGANVNYGADHIFCDRDYSKELTLKLAAQIANFEGIDLPVMNNDGWYNSSIQIRNERCFTDLLREARHCYSVTTGKYIGGRFGHLPQWIECMIS